VLKGRRGVGAVAERPARIEIARHAAVYLNSERDVGELRFATREPVHLDRASFVLPSGTKITHNARR